MNGTQNGEAGVGVRTVLLPVKYMAAIKLERGAVEIEIAEIPSDKLADVIAHALKAMEQAGLTASPEPPAHLESVGGYAPLDVREDPFEQGKKIKRVGF